MRLKSFVSSPLQHGSAMLMALLILIVLTLLGVFASSSGIMQERMSGNFRDSARAFEAAEAGLRWYEAWLASIRNPVNQPLPRSAACGPSDVDWESVDAPFRTVPIDSLTVFPWTVASAYGVDPISGAALAGSTNSLGGAIPIIKTQPKIIVEHVYFARDTLGTTLTGVHFYRITSGASGGIANNVAVVESTFARRFE
jgi:type IV pilus assembly protein PilX